MGIFNRWFRKREEIDVDNAALLKAMQAVATDNKIENRVRLYRTMLASTLVIPTPELPPAQEGPYDADGSMTVAMVSMVDTQGRKIMPAFTDVAALENWDPNTPCFGVKAQAFFQMVRGTDIEEIVINPFDPIRKMLRSGGRITRAEIDALADGLIPEGTGDTIQLAVPRTQAITVTTTATPLPANIEEAVRNAAAIQPDIDALYCFASSLEGGSPHMCIGVHLRAPGDSREQEIISKVITAVRPLLAANASLDFVALRGALLDRARQVGTRIYP